MVPTTVFDMKFLCCPKRWSIRAIMSTWHLLAPRERYLGTKFSLHVLRPSVQRVHKILLSDILEGTVYVPVDQYRLPVDPSTHAFDLECLIFEVCMLSHEGLRIAKGRASQARERRRAVGPWGALRPWRYPCRRRQFC
jgi:hypothetical protein